MNKERRDILKGVVKNLDSIKENGIGGTDATEMLQQCYDDIDECLFEERECLDKALAFSIHSKRVKSHDKAIAGMEDANREISIAIKELNEGVSSVYDEIGVYVEFAISKIRETIEG